MDKESTQLETIRKSLQNLDKSLIEKFYAEFKNYRPKRVNQDTGFKRNERWLRMVFALSYFSVIRFRILLNISISVEPDSAKISINH